MQDNSTLGDDGVINYYYKLILIQVLKYTYKKARKIYMMFKKAYFTVPYAVKLQF